ncbi:hypothetical protein DSO57_1012530 [Entomophthora muscae]|uniref:Uncharacterized protein n=1 Tax=Entomophthora muscae TaxID=34485 RepID=A0ACC2SUT6_9FUNG|nr:hypothetical protein DSO57_1012530 [Entomophthora muscae]
MKIENVYMFFSMVLVMLTGKGATKSMKLLKRSQKSKKKSKRSLRLAKRTIQAIY